ncbi:MAG: right-handed parallel beta-helix repeat-containing protein [Dokdonella sp.]
MTFSFPRLLAAALAAVVIPAVAEVADAVPQAADTFTVTTPADNANNAAPTVGSLRWAIQQANANSNLTTINFSMPGCPVVMSLGGAVLPDVTSSVTIDGYSAAGSSANTTFGLFNATLCVLLNGNGSLANGLHTSGNGRLDVSGLGFAGFTDAAIRLDSGNGNVVSGNQIGGIILLAQNKDGVRVSATAMNSIIGGDANPGRVNLIVGNTGAGVSVDSAGGGNFVDHDLIGIGPDGVAVNGNNVGVYIFNSPANYVLSCLIAGNATQGVLIAGPSTVGTTLQNNAIGQTNTGGNAANGTEGVQITFGAAASTIGATQTGVIDGNTIYANGAAVWLTSTAGQQNRVLANQEMYSAILGLPVDLGAAGPTANDALDADAGPNGLQNYPVMLHAYRTLSAEWIEGTLDTVAGEEFRLDLYWSPCCGSGRGNATYFAGIGSSGTTDVAGHAHFWIRTPPFPYPSVGRLSATATRTNGDTSETGDAAAEIVGDMIFRDDFESP